MEDAVGNRYFVPFRAGTGSSTPVGNIGLGYDPSLMAAAQDDGNGDVLSPSTFAARLNAGLRGAIIQMYIYNNGKGWKPPALVSPQALSANADLKRWATEATRTDVSRQKAPWFVDNNNIDLTNYDRIPTFETGIVPEAFRGR